MKMMKWAFDLEAFALKNSEKCIFKHSSSEERKAISAGENIYLWGGSFKKVG